MENVSLDNLSWFPEGLPLHCTIKEREEDAPMLGVTSLFFEVVED